MKKHFKLFLLFWFLAFFTFLKSWNAGWTYDSIRFSCFVKQYSLLDLLNKHIDHSLQYFYYFIYYILDKLFGTQGFDWYILKISLHSLNALILYECFNFLQILYRNKTNSKISFIACILFLIAPTASEVVLYQAAIHFMYCTTLLISCLLLFLTAIENPTSKKLITFYILYILALFTLETSYTFGGIIFLLIFLLPKEKMKNKFPYYIKYSLVPVLLVFGYLLLNKIILNDFVGHYGSEKHLNWGIDKIIQNITKIPLDAYLLIEYWNMDKIYSIYNMLYNHNYNIILLTLYVLFYLFLAYKAYYNPTIFGLIFLLLNLILLMLLPTLSLGILYIQPVEEDRYLYYFIGFVYFILLIGLSNFSNKIVYTVGFMLIILSFISTKKNTYNWSITQKIIDNSIPTFPFHENKKYLILASPEYANGVLIWDTNESKENPFYDKYQILAKALFVKQNINVFDKIGTVLQYNIINEKESPIIEKVNDTTLKMTLPCCGKWWWKYGVGANNYENEYYKVELIGGWEQEVKIYFKQKPEDFIYLYQCGDKFCEFKF